MFIYNHILKFLDIITAKKMPRLVLNSHIFIKYPVVKIFKILNYFSSLGIFFFINKNLLFKFNLLLDSPKFGQIFFQDPSTNIFEKIISLHHELFFFRCLLLLIGLFCLLMLLFFNFEKLKKKKNIVGVIFFFLYFVVFSFLYFVVFSFFYKIIVFLCILYIHKNTNINFIEKNFFFFSSLILLPFIFFLNLPLFLINLY